MLVLSRQPQQRVLLPDLGISVQVLNIKGSCVRIGIEAPPGVAILREELNEEPASRRGRRGSKLTHLINNRLNRIGLSLQLVRRQYQAGLIEQAEASLETALQAVDRMSSEGLAGFLNDAPPPVAPSRRMLVVEDDANERELLASLLRMEGCEVRTASDGEEALEHLSAERPDLVLLDMWMPRCNGPQTVQRIRNEPALGGLKIFAVSGTAPHDLGVPTGPGGVDAWFPKPLNALRLLESIRQNLAAPSTVG